MQQEEQSVLSFGQQLGITLCYVVQFFVLSFTALFSNLLSRKPSRYQLREHALKKLVLKSTPSVLAIASFPVGLVLVVGTWRGFGTLSSDYWGEMQLFIMLLSSMLSEVVIFEERQYEEVFAKTYNNGRRIKRCLQLLSCCGIIILLADTGIRGPVEYLLIAAGVFRGSMILASFIIRLRVARVSFETSEAITRSDYWKKRIFLDVRLLYEGAVFGLLFLSFSNIFSSRVNYKLLLNGIFILVGLLDGVVRIKGFYEDKALEKLRKITETMNVRPQGHDGVSLSDLSRTESVVACSMDHLVHAIGGGGTGRDAISLSSVSRSETLPSGSVV